MKKSNLLKNNKKLMQEYNYEKNTNIDLNDITLGSNKKVWWKCSNGHEWNVIIRSRNKGAKCPICNKEHVEK